MSGKIKLLPEIVANQIAAGEVVDHPASVVKEMMENAIDAGARSVKVNFRDGGKELIQVVDDGCGMSPIDARMAFDRHATSKIESVDDIYRLSTFGFRGEALASIAAVSQVELRTRRAEDETGTLTEVNGGQCVGQQPVACPAGSQFCVRNLYYNVPARRHFLEKSTTSAANIKTEFRRVALCYPQVAFELYANDAPVYSLPAGSLAGRIVDVVGRHIKQNLLEVGADSSIARIGGFIGRPAAAKRRNCDQYLFVNGRFFKSPYLTAAIMRAYDKLIPEGSQPSYFLYLTVDPERVDVNVHPRKTEVKFSEEEAVWQIVNAAVRETLAKSGAVSLMDFDNEPAVDIPVMQQGVVYREPEVSSGRNYNPFDDNYIDTSGVDSDFDTGGFDMPMGGAGRLSDTSVAGYGGRRRRTDFAAGLVPDSSFAVGQDAEEFEEFASADDFEEIESTLDFSDDESARASQQSLELSSAPQFSAALAVGECCALVLMEGRPVVVDMRRVRERLLYEDYLHMASGAATATQKLLFPERLVLAESDYELLEENAVEVASVGFDLEFRGCGVVEVMGTPAEVPVEGVDTLLYELLQLFATPVSAMEVRHEKIAAVMARAAARMTPQRLSQEEMRSLLDRLSAAGNRSFSPSGKPLVAELSLDELRTKLG